MADRQRLVQLKQELEWRKCRKDVFYFLEHYWHIRHPARGKILFELRGAQRRGLQHWIANRYSLTLKARQIGWSTLVAAYAAWLCIFHSDQQIIFVSRTEREAHKLLAKTKYGWKHLPEWMKRRSPSLTANTLEEMEWDNDSSIASRPSASDPARGESASLIVVDEWAFLPNPEEAWASMEPVADVGGSIIGLSTANGWGEFFHTLWVGAKAGTNQFKGIFEPWHANEDRDADWYEAKKRALPSWQLAQEYPDNEDEAFIKSGRVVFDVDDLRQIETSVAPRFQVLFKAEKLFEVRPDEHGELTVWEGPKVGGNYVIGADVAEGLDHGDYSSAHVIDVRSGMVVAHWHGHIAADLFGRVLWALGVWYQDALIIPEANNHGLTTVTELRRLGCRRLYRRRPVNSANKKLGIQYGWATNVTTKPLMIDDLAKALRERAIDLRDEETIAELRTFVRDSKGRMAGSPFDDRVISLALAVQGIPLAHQPEYAPHQEAPEFSLEWWAKLRHTDRLDSTDDWVIGGNSVRASA